LNQLNCLFFIKTKNVSKPGGKSLPKSLSGRLAHQPIYVIVFIGLDMTSSFIGHILNLKVEYGRKMKEGIGISLERKAFDL